MVPEWPITAASQGREASPARRAERGRLATVRADFFLDPAKRLTEQERALMNRMLAELVGTVADELAAAAVLRSAANDQERARLLPRLSAAGLLDDSDLIDLLLRRADEERMAAALKARSGARTALLQSLVAADQAAVAAAAMALILARGRRRDRFGQIRLDFDDLSPRTARRLVFAVAAGLHALDGGDEAALAGAAAALIERRDGAKAAHALVEALVDALAAEQALDEALLGQMAEQGEVALLAAALARLGSIDAPIAWDHLLFGADERLILLLRMAGVSRAFAGTLLALIGDLAGIADPAADIAAFDSLDEARVEQARAWLRLAPGYRAAAAAIEANRG